MVYVYRKIVGGNPYYYLRISQRKGEKIASRDIAYLGSSLQEVERALEQLPKHAAAIRKAHKTISKFLTTQRYHEQARTSKPRRDAFLTPKTLLDIEASRLHYEDRVSRLDEHTQEEVFDRFLTDFAYNTTSMEGNTITLAQAHKLLEEGLLPKDKTLREVYDLQNTRTTFHWVRTELPPITEATIIRIHDDLLAKIDERKGYRAHDVRVYKSTFDASPWKYIAADMRSLIAWYHTQEKKLHPLSLAVIMHHKLERIHPFGDGNGRTGRMLMNLILLRHTYPPMIITKRQRSTYLAALRKADAAALLEMPPSAYTALVTLAAAEFLRSYAEHFIV